jgi:flavodoxin
MKKALVVYCSKTGITKEFSNEIGRCCSHNGLEIKILSIDEFNNDALADVDYLFLGCWTHGLMILFQHPDKPWVNFAQSLPQLHGKKIVLFTTYKLATGSMFKKMRKFIRCESNDIMLELKSRDGTLIESHAILLKNIFSVQP